MPDPEQLKELILDSLKAYNGSNDVELLQWNESPGEETISHRLAYHVERKLVCQDRYGLDKLSVDCEYDKHGDNPKRLEIPRENEELKKLVEAVQSKELSITIAGDYEFGVRPDIVVHERHSDEHNLIVIEVKKASEDIKRKQLSKYARAKLRLFTDRTLNRFRYQLGVYVIADDLTVGEGAGRLKPEEWFI